MATLLLCETCTRYFRAGEAVCPFCATAPTRRMHLSRVALPSGASRGRIYAARLAALASAATFVACTDKGEVGAATEGPEEADASTMERGPGSSQDDETTSPTGQSSTSSAGSPSTTRPNSGTGGGGAAGNGGNAGTVGNTGGGPIGPGPVMAADAGVAGSGPSTIPNGSGLGGMACPGYEEVNSDAQTCSMQAECAGGTVCSTVTVYDESSPGPNCNAIGFSQCDPASCFGVCQPQPNGCGEYCVEDCNPESCTGTSQCVDNVCVTKPCDADGAADCGTSYVCDPGAEGANAQGCRLLQCHEANGIACPELYRCAEAGEVGDYRGCVRLLCDEPNGPSCPELSACRSDDEGAGPIGCVELDCSEAGGPTCDEGKVCRPESVYANVGSQKGCTRLQCDEGGDACAETHLCLPDNPRADALGCVLTPCDMGWECEPFRDCNVSAIGAGADAHGCVDRACTVDTDCACGYCVNLVCEPIQGTCRIPEIVANPYGCVWPDDEFV